MTTLTDRCIEVMARAICKDRNTGQCAALCLSHSSNFTSKGQCPEAVRINGRLARLNFVSLLSELDAAGWQVVPQEATEEMVTAGWIDKEDVSPAEIYTAMLAAAPKPFGESVQ